jgi:hypothetical protein
LGQPGKLLSFNQFAYCRNNPVNRYDPYGYSDAGAMNWLWQAGEAAAAFGSWVLSGVKSATPAGAFLLVVSTPIECDDGTREGSTPLYQSTPASPDPNDDNDDFFKGVDISKWHKGGYTSAKDSFKDHYIRHGDEVGANSPAQYFRKALEFSKNLRGATKKITEGYTDGVIRYYKNGRYIDIAPDGKIVSFGSK